MNFMIKKVDFIAISEKEEKLRKVLQNLEEVKVEFAEIVDAYEKSGAKIRVVDILTESLEAVEDAIDGINEVLE